MKCATSGIGNGLISHILPGLGGCVRAAAMPWSSASFFRSAVFLCAFFHFVPPCFAGCFLSQLHMSSRAQSPHNTHFISASMTVHSLHLLHISQTIPCLQMIDLNIFRPENHLSWKTFDLNSFRFGNFWEVLESQMGDVLKTVWFKWLKPVQVSRFSRHVSGPGNWFKGFFMVFKDF